MNKKCKECGKELEASVEVCECGSKEFEEIKPKAADKPIGSLSDQLKEILPQIANFKSILGDAVNDHSKVKEVTDQLKNIEGNITQLSEKVIKIGNKEIEVKSTGWSNEKKMNFAKFCVNVARFGAKGGWGDKSNYLKSVKEVQDKYSEVDAEGKALNTGTDADGGFLIPTAFTAEIQRVMADASMILQRARRVPITSGNEIPVLSLLTGNSAAWVAEAGPVGQSDPTFSEDRTKLQKLQAYSLMSNELLEDEEVGLADFLVTLFGEDMGEKIDLQGFQGTGAGVATQQPFTGILNASGVNSVSMTGSGFSSVTFDDLEKMTTELQRSVINGAGFIMHRTILSVLRRLKDGDDNYIYAPPGGDQPATIWGWPFELNDQMPALTDTAASTAFLIFGNMQNYQWGDKGGMTVRVTDIPNILTDQTILVVRRRIALAMGLPGAFSVLSTGTGS